MRRRRISRHVFPHVEHLGAVYLSVTHGGIAERLQVAHRPAQGVGRRGYRHDVGDLAGVTPAGASVTRFLVESELKCSASFASAELKKPPIDRADAFNPPVAMVRYPPAGRNVVFSGVSTVSFGAGDFIRDAAVVAAVDPDPDVFKDFRWHLMVPIMTASAQIHIRVSFASASAVTFTHTYVSLYQVLKYGLGLIVPIGCYAVRLFCERGICGRYEFYKVDHCLELLKVSNANLKRCYVCHLRLPVPGPHVERLAD